MSSVAVAYFGVAVYAFSLPQRRGKTVEVTPPVRGGEAWTTITYVFPDISKEWQWSGLGVRVCTRSQDHRVGIRGQDPQDMDVASGTCQSRWKAKGTFFGLCHYVGTVKVTVSSMPHPRSQRGRGVEKSKVKLTFEKMAALMSPASSSTRRIHRSSSVGRVTDYTVKF